MFRVMRPKREAGTGSTLTLKGARAASPGFSALAGMVGLRSSLTGSGGGRAIPFTVGASGNPAGARGVGLDACSGNGKARGTSREADWLFFRGGGFGESAAAGDASVAAATYALTGVRTVDSITPAGPGAAARAFTSTPMARMDSTRPPPGESNSRRKVTSPFLGQYTMLL